MLTLRHSRGTQTKRFPPMNAGTRRKHEKDCLLIQFVAKMLISVRDAALLPPPRLPHIHSPLPAHSSRFSPPSASILRCSESDNGDRFPFVDSSTSPPIGQFRMRAMIQSHEEISSTFAVTRNPTRHDSMKPSIEIHACVFTVDNRTSVNHRSSYPLCAVKSRRMRRLTV